MTKVSVILPIYNVEKYLEKALDCIVNQSLKEIEIICVCDGIPLQKNSDKSVEIVKNYAQKDPRIKIIELNENYGQGVARNIGIDNATGKYIMFLDPDDTYELDACETLYLIAESNNANVVQGVFKIINENTQKITITDYFVPYNIQPNTFVDLKKVNTATLNSFSMVSWGKIYLLDFIKKNNIRFSSHRRYEDHRFMIDVKLSTPIFYTNKYIYNYLKRENSSTCLKIPHEEIIKEVYDVILKHKSWSKIWEKYDKYVVYHYLLKYKTGYQASSFLKFCLDNYRHLNLHQLFLLIRTNK